MIRLIREYWLLGYAVLLLAFVLSACAPSITITGNNNTVMTMTSTAGTFTLPLPIPGV
jgi:hypothetical protein